MIRATAKRAAGGRAFTITLRGHYAQLFYVDAALTFLIGAWLTYAGVTTARTASGA